MLSKRMLITILLLFLMVFMLFMSFTVFSNALLSGKQENPRALDTPVTLEKTASETSVYGGRSALVLAGDKDAARTIVEWCGYSKYDCTFMDQMPDAAAAAEFDLVIFGEMPITASDTGRLLAYAQAGATMIFTEPPDYALLEKSPTLRNFFGIDKCVSGEYDADGAYLYADFFLSGARIYTHDDFYGEDDDMDITVPYYTLRAGYEVYMTAMLDSQDELGIADEDMPPLIWRTVTRNSEIFIVNTDLFSGEAMLGVLTACASHIGDVCVYPVVNARTVNVLNFPWATAENSDEIAAIYGHAPESLSSDIVWPGVLQILGGFTRHANFFAAARYDYESAPEYSQRLCVYYLKQVKKLLGTYGLSLKTHTPVSLAEVVSENQAFFESELPDYEFTCVYAGDFEPEKILQYIGESGSVMEKVSMILAPADDNEAILEALDKNVLAVRLITDSLTYEARDDMAMVSLQTALGLCGQYTDMSRTLFPESDADYWNKQSIKWSSGVTYYREFEAFDYVTVDEMEDRARAFLNLEYDYEVSECETLLRASEGGAYFIVRLYGKRLTGMTGGEYEQITDTAYLIKVTDAEATLRTEDAHALAEP